MSAAEAAWREERPAAVHVPIAGVERLSLPVERDARGSLVELCRAVWIGDDAPVQWNAITNRPRALRGIHWHNRHVDYITPVAGAIVAALVDLRVGSPTEHAAVVLELDAARPEAVVVPPGVGHGFFSHEASVVMYGVSAYWDPADELGVAWNDPALGIRWPEAARNAIVSDRDRSFRLLADAAPRLRWSG